MRISRKIKALRTRLGLTQAELGAKVGADQTTVAKWENERQKPSHESGARLARLAGETTEQFYGLVPQPDPEGMRRVRVIGSLQAGSWSEAAEWPEDVQYDVPAPLLEDWADIDIHAMEVAGTSMNRYYPEGSIVYVAPIAALGRMPKNGERVVVQRVDASGLYEATLKEYVIDEAGKVWLWPRSYDPEHQAPLPYKETKRRVDNIHVLGVVIASLVLEASRPASR